MQKMTKREYRAYVKTMCPASPLGKDVFHAFWVGGLICVLGQLLRTLYLRWGMGEEGAAAAVSITLIFGGALLTGLGVYPKLAKYAGGGTLVPITGFSNAIVAPALEFKTEGMILGTGARLFTVAGPVLVYGISASMVYGFLYRLMGLG